mmetsp:Transcript_24684/g.47369  ORF Transcript_24684/g.47369 Transcript_24684/m.47369 type:complete len:497 (+) Transcript_24684:94-1584(+)
MSEYNPSKTKNSPAMESADALALLGCSRSSLPQNHSACTAESNNTTATDSQPILAFPKTLMEMMDYCDEMNSKRAEDSDKFCVTWLPDGKSFLVRDPTEFARTIIPKFFKPSKFTSFARRLYRWGFRQFTSLDTDGTAPPLDAVAFSAPYFSRDAKHELIKMKNGGGRGSEKKTKMTGNRRGTSTSKFNCNSNICNRKKKRISFVSVNTNESIDNDISDISNESSQGPLKKRKIGTSAESAVTIDGCNVEYNKEKNVPNDTALDLKISDYFFGCSNNMMDHSHANNGAPSQVHSRQCHKRTSEAVSDQAGCRGNDALFRLLLSNIVANRNQTQSKNAQPLPQHTRVTSNTCHHVPGVPIAYDRQSLEGIVGFLQGVHMKTTTPNVSAPCPATLSASSTDSQAALLRHLESMKTPQHQTQLTSHAIQDNEISSAMTTMKNLFAQYNSIIAQQQQLQVFSKMNAAILNMQQQQRQQQQSNMDAAVSCLIKYMLFGNFN